MQHLTGSNRAKCTALNIPRQCMFILVKMSWRAGKTFEVEKVEMKGGARRKFEQGPTLLN
jgi:hypothetical protein